MGLAFLLCQLCLFDFVGFGRSHRSKMSCLDSAALARHQNLELQGRRTRHVFGEIFSQSMLKIFPLSNFGETPNLQTFSRDF